jgi:hypothetical protein
MYNIVAILKEIQLDEIDSLCALHFLLPLDFFFWGGKLLPLDCWQLTEQVRWGERSTEADTRYGLEQNT